MTARRRTPRVRRSRVLLELELQECRQRAFDDLRRSRRKRISQKQHANDQIVLMTLSGAPGQLQRRAGVARLLYKYGSRDLVLLALLIVGAALVMQVP